MEITIKKNGPTQPRAYADSISSYRVFLSEPMGHLSQQQQGQYIRGLARAACGRETANSAEESQWPNPYINEVRCISSTEWLVRITHPFLD